jgi:septum formation protein
LFLKSPPPLILASTSRYRRELLERLGLPFTGVAPGVDESPAVDERPSQLVSRLAKAKASAVALLHPQAWVIGSDQVAVLGTPGTPTILGKPGTEERCRAQLMACSNTSVDYLTAVALMRHETQELIEFTDRTQVSFRKLDQDTVARYVTKEQPLDCAGGFKSEGLGIALCNSIFNTDPTALIGLPLIRLAAALRTAGFDLP